MRTVLKGAEIRIPGPSPGPERSPGATSPTPQHIIDCAVLFGYFLDKCRGGENMILRASALGDTSLQEKEAV